MQVTQICTLAMAQKNPLVEQFLQVLRDVRIDITDENKPPSDIKPNK